MMTSKSSNSASVTMSSLGKACLELSRTIKGFRFNRSSASPADMSTAAGGAAASSNSTPSTAAAVAAAKDSTSGGVGPPSSAVEDGSPSSSSSSLSSLPLVGSVSVGEAIVDGGSSVTNAISRVLRSATSRVRAFPSSPPTPTLMRANTNGHSPAHAPLTQQQQQQQQTATPVARPGCGRVPAPDVWIDEKFLLRFFQYFTAVELCVLAQVCSRWRDVLYRPRLWRGVTPVVHCRQLQSPTVSDDARRAFFRSLERRGFDSICLVGAVDTDADQIDELFPYARTDITELSVRCSNVTDRGLERLLDLMASVVSLDLSGCNEVTESGLWTALARPRIVCLSISDCINVADDTVAAVAQLLPQLRELNLQAYHVTDAALALFNSPPPTSTITSGCVVSGSGGGRPLRTLRLHSCWEITNHGVLNVVRTLPSLTVLSLSGCSKVTDDGVEVIAENLRQLRALDLSWCSRITDAALEYIACDLGQLEELTLDRCCHVTDIGVGYLSTMTSLCRLYLRWCTLLRDFGLQHLYTMKSLTALSLAGCNLLSAAGVSGLVQLTNLQELELTNCPCILTSDVCRFLRDRLSRCVVLD